MSKIKDELERIHEREYQAYVDFMEFVSQQELEVSEHDTKEEQENSQESSSPGTSIVSTKTLKMANNINYNPTKQGA